MSLVLLLAFIALMVAVIPVAHALVIASGIALLWEGMLPLLLLVQQMFQQTQSFPMLALPFFVLAGTLIMEGHLGGELLRFTGELMQRVRGGALSTTVVGSVVFGGVSGSAVANASALGSVLIPWQKRQGYPAGLCAANNATSAGQDIGAIPARRFARLPLRRRSQMVFQDPTDSLNPRFTAARAIADLILRLGDIKGAKAVRARCEELACQVGLPVDLLDHFPRQLSGGQKARVGIARAIAVNPGLVILGRAHRGARCVCAGGGSQPAAGAAWFSWQNTLLRAAPLLLTALCVALPARPGLVVIGGEGALVLGGLVAAWVAMERTTFGFAGDAGGRVGL